MSASDGAPPSSTSTRSTLTLDEIAQRSTLSLEPVVLLYRERWGAYLETHVRRRAHTRSSMMYVPWWLCRDARHSG